MNRADELTTCLTTALEFVDSNMDDMGLSARPGIDFSRRAKLGRKDVMMALVSMSGGALAKELDDCGLAVRPSTFVEARKKIPAAAFWEWFNWFNENCGGMDWRKLFDRRILAVDGSAINMFRNPTAPSFMQNAGHPDGINQLHLNAIYDICNNTYFDALIQPQPQTNEVQALIDMIADRQFREKTLLVADRGYQSYNLIEHIRRKENLDFLVRVKDSRTSWKAIQQLPVTELDTDIITTVTTTQKNSDKAAGHVFLQTYARGDKDHSTRRHAGAWDFESPCAISFRVVRFQLSTGKWETLVTSLPRSISANDIKELYHARWGIETSFRHLKTALGLVYLHGKSDDFVKQEIFAQVTAFNFASRICGAVPIEQRGENIYQYQVNFKYAVGLCRKYLKGADITSGELLEKIARQTVPIRPGRADKRKLTSKGFVGFTYRVAA